MPRFDGAWAVLPDEAIPPVNCALCQVLHGLEYADMKFGDVVVIQGAGGLGIYACAVAAHFALLSLVRKAWPWRQRTLWLVRRCGGAQSRSVSCEATSS